MQTPTIGVLDPTISILRKFEQWRSIPIFHISPSHSTSKKCFGTLANGLKKRMVEVAVVVSSLFLVLFSLISYPFRRLSPSQAAERFETALDAQISRFHPEEIAARETMIQTYFEKHAGVFSSKSSESKKKMIREIIAQCALTEKVLAPVARDWVDHLLDTANRNGQKLMFIARDGTPYYEIASKLMELPEYKQKYPNLAKKGAISLVYFSRKVVQKFAVVSEENGDLFRRYIFAKTGVQGKDRYLFADVGFEGTLIGDLRKLLPEVDCKFSFLVATRLTPEEGYLGSPQDPLSNFQTKCGVLTTRWLEEPHHGTIASPKRLVVNPKDGTIHPDTLYPKKVRFEEKFSEHHLYRKFCTKQLIRAAVDLDPLTRDQWSKARERFNQLAGEINSGKIPLFVDKWDR